MQLLLKRLALIKGIEEEVRYRFGEFVQPAIPDATETVLNGEFQRPWQFLPAIYSSPEAGSMRVPFVAP
jgi:hypothetical protein